LGGLTPVSHSQEIQDIAFILEAFARQGKEEIVLEKKIAAKVKGVRKCSCSKAYKIMRIANAAHDGVVQRNADTELVLAGLRRNGQ
jgi:hypothetical protein